MIHACDLCAEKEKMRWRTPVGDGPFACVVCGQRTANALWSNSHTVMMSEVRAWRQGYVGTFPALCSAYGRACSAISAFEDDASIPLDEHIATLVKRLAAAEAEVKRLAAIPAGVGRTITRPVFPIDPAEFGEELTRRRAVPAEVANEVREAMNDALAEEAAYDISYIPPRTKRAAVLARYIRTLAAGEAAEHE